MLFLAPPRRRRRLEGRDHVLPDDVQALAPSVPPTACSSYEVDGDQREAVIREAIDRVPAL
jgi:MoxR-like ATPase